MAGLEPSAADAKAERKRLKKAAKLAAAQALTSPQVSEIDKAKRQKKKKQRAAEPKFGPASIDTNAIDLCSAPQEGIVSGESMQREKKKQKKGQELGNDIAPANDDVELESGAQRKKKRKKSYEGREVAKVSPFSLLIKLEGSFS